MARAVRLEAVSGAITVNAQIDGGSGAVSVLSSGAQSYGTAGDIVTTGTATIDVNAGGAITMAAGTSLAAGSGNVRVAATGALALGSITTAGDVSLLAQTITDAGVTDRNVRADELRIQTTGTASGAGAGTGAAGGALDIQVRQLAADVLGTGSGGVFLNQSGAITVGAVSAIDVVRVGVDGATTGSAGDAGLSNLRSAGHVVLVASGTITTLSGSGAVSATSSAEGAQGNVLLKASGATSDVVLGAALSSGAGHLSVAAERHVEQNATITASAAGKTIDVQAGGAIRMGTGTHGSVR